MPRARGGATLLAVVVSLAVAGCSGGGRGGVSLAGASTAAATSSTPTPTSTGAVASGASGSTASGSAVAGSTLPASGPVQAAPETIPLVLLHGHGGDPEDWGAFLDLAGPGRVVVRSIYAAEADALKPGDLPLGCIVSAGYYRDTVSGTKFDPDANGRGTGSIGGCPAPRDDGLAARYPVSYAARVARIVEGVRRATGSDRVDLALHSMGNVVGRAYTRWLSDGARGGKSKVRRLLCIVGPHRGVNALEATIDGLEHASVREFMTQGELAEMCWEYKGWQGRSYMDRLNEDWDPFCSRTDVSYGGISATGAVGHQVDPHAQPGAAGSGPSIFGIHLPGPLDHIAKAIMQLNFTTLGDTLGFFFIWVPQVVGEVQEALGPGDGTVRLASSRLDQAPFQQAEFWAPFEGRHGDTWNNEQASQCSTFTVELAREFLYEKSLLRGGQVASCQLGLVDAPGRASWLALETTVSGAPLVSAQVVEERLDAQGNPTGAAASYGCPVPQGTQRAFIPIPAGGGQRRYKVVLYGPDGAVFSKDNLVFATTDGALEAPPATTIAGASSVATPAGPVAHATATSNAAASDPTLAFSWKLDGGAWSPFLPGGTFDTPPLGPGEHRLEARSAHASNAAGLLCQDARGTAVTLVVDAGGAVTPRK